MPRRSETGKWIVADWQQRQRRWAASFKEASKRSHRSVEQVAYAVGVVRAGRALEDARRQLVAVRSRLTDLEAGGMSTALVVGAAMKTGVWATTVEPWFEGPAACKLRVGDLVAIRDAGGKPIRAQDI